MKEIAAALVRAQKQFGPALKTTSNAFFKSKYADLAACIEAVLDGLNNNGIALIQHCHENDNGVIVETIFVHESGETYSTGKLHVPAAKQDPQGYGSALTYARRYSLMAACGIAPEDDDGNAGSKPKSKRNDTDFAALLTGLREASLNGLKSLQDAVAKLPEGDEYDLLWSENKASLLKAAKDADKSRSEKMMPNEIPNGGLPE